MKTGMIRLTLAVVVVGALLPPQPAARVRQSSSRAAPVVLIERGIVGSFQRSENRRRRPLWL